MKLLELRNNLWQLLTHIISIPVSKINSKDDHTSIYFIIDTEPLVSYQKKQ